MDYLQFKELYHSGAKGQKWGVRRYQYYDGTYTEEGKERYFGSGKRIRNDGIDRDNAIDAEYREVYKLVAPKAEREYNQYSDDHDYHSSRTDDVIEVIRTNTNIPTVYNNQLNKNNNTSSNDTKKDQQNNNTSNNTSNSTSNNDTKKDQQNNNTSNKDNKDSNQQKGNNQQNDNSKDYSKALKEAQSITKDLQNVVPSRPDKKVYKKYPKLSDQELGERIKRVTLERQYSDLIGDTKVVKSGSNRARELLQSIGALAGIGVSIVTIWSILKGKS